MARNKNDSQRATIYDVADEAGVAISTVSRVLNDSEDVSETTRERVLESIRRLNFRPDRTAKSLAQRSIPTFAIACPTFITPFHNELLKGVRMGLSNVTADLLICDLAWTNPHQTLYEFLNRGRVDGLMLAGVETNDELITELRSLQAPVVLIGSESEHFHSFVWDEVAGAELATTHLIERGHRRIGILLPPIESPLQQHRIEGYQRALKKADIPYDESLAITGETEKHAGFSEESGYEAMNTLLNSDTNLTAVFAGSDVQAIGAWMAVREHGLKVPGDIAIIGYDDIKTSAFIGLTTIAQHMYEVGQKAAQLVVKQLEDGMPELVTEHVEAKLCIRDTT